MASNCRECELIIGLIAERGDVSAHVAAFLLDGHIVRGRDGHFTSGALPPATEFLVSSSGAVTVSVSDAGQQNERSGASFSLGGSMVGGAVPTAAAPSAVAHTHSAQDRLETRGSTASQLAERRGESSPEVAPARLTPRGSSPGRTFRPQAVPPRPDVRDSLAVCPRKRDPLAVFDTLTRLVAEVVGTSIEIVRGTSLTYDAELESSELVRLGRLLGEVYGSEVDVLAWFGEMDVDDLIALTAGEVADFVVWCLD